MELTLGLDLGSNSIGWALLDEVGHRIVAAGVRVFPEGVDRDTKGAEVSKNEQRRVARMMRRQIARRARRKRQLRRALVAAGLLPLVALLPRNDAQRVEWERLEFNREDPWSIRARARREQITLFELGRVLVHLNQRRGFQSNRKTDRANRKESSEMLAEISALAAEMGESTLGEYMASRRGADPKAYHRTRIRGHHTRRDMLTAEFDAIWEAQRQYHPARLTEELREQLRRIIFYQRPLRPVSPSLVGRCELEPRLPRCPRADRRAQRFRMYLEVNNLRVMDMSTREERPLTPEERARLLAYLASAKERTFDQIRKHLFDQYESLRFNLERGDRNKLKGMPTDAVLSGKKLFAKAWSSVSESLKDKIVAALIDADSIRLQKLLGHAGLDPAKAELLLDEVSIEEGYASYSLHAIKKLLPFVERGLPLTSRSASQPCALREAGYTMPWESASEKSIYLGDPPKVTNPLVRQALYEVRKVVNAILRELVYREGHTLARIHLELAREVRGTLAERQKRAMEMREREKMRSDAAERIREYGAQPTRDAITRYLLWREQNEECIYSGRKISMRQLLGGEVDIDHILPYSRTLDDSLMNKVVCFRDENTGKRDRTPFEWLAETDPAKYEQVLQRARRLPHYPKSRRFLIRQIELDDFFARQFVDTAYITTQVLEYLKCLGADIVCLKGAHTAELRHQWGLNSVLRNDDLDLKNREDHRHHAVDAIVVALTNRSRLQQLAALWRAGGTERTGEILPEPWRGFRDETAKKIDEIHVSHKTRRRVRGALHLENPFGATPESNVFVKRKPLTSISLSEVERIRDHAIRNYVIHRLKTEGIDAGRGKSADAKRISAILSDIRFPSGIPVRKVRVLVQDETITPIHNNTAFVKTGAVHHACVFEIIQPGVKPRKDAVYVSLLEAARRIRDREPLVQRSHPEISNAKFLMSVSPGDSLLVKLDGKERLMIVSTLVSTQKRIHVVDARDARPGTQKKDIGKTPNSLNARKVIVDPIGRIRWAND